MNKPYWTLLGNLLPIAVGTAVYAFGLHYFVITNGLMEGGITGVALLLNYIAGFPPSLTTLVINIPLFLLGWRMLGKASMLYTVCGTLLLSFFLWVMEELIHSGAIAPFRTESDYFLVSAYAGVTLGAGLGLVFRYGGTTGGSDIVARILHKKRGWSVGRLILAIDAVVLGASLLFLPKEKIMYTLVVVFISSKVIDILIEGAYAAKSFTIISDHAERLAERITDELDRGVTIFPAIGAFSGQPKNVVYCVVALSEIKRLKDLVHAIDSRAFVIITEVHDVVGEGFKPVT
ncbi:YitT family protein [Paenibacillus puerhi]|uniref:YitT family protein n=1 Tax=Paenibacillus puerhi TaxID=2692622 RepID=UPI001F24B551|nr:YitT family protein [Paenibacillus puerhi]